MLLIFSTLGIPALPLSTGSLFGKPSVESKYCQWDEQATNILYTCSEFICRCMESSGGAEKLKKKIHIHVQGREGRILKVYFYCHAMKIKVLNKVC